MFVRHNIYLWTRGRKKEMKKNSQREEKKIKQEEVEKCLHVVDMYIMRDICICTYDTSTWKGLDEIQEKYFCHTRPDSCGSIHTYKKKKEKYT